MLIINEATGKATYPKQPLQKWLVYRGFETADSQSLVCGLNNRWFKTEEMGQGITDKRADEIATSLGVHPAQIWGEDYWVMGELIEWYIEVVVPANSSLASKKYRAKKAGIPFEEEIEATPPVGEPIAAEVKLPVEPEVEPEVGDGSVHFLRFNSWNRSGVNFDVDDD